ncbi:UNVERIFIED_CONTAM: hypothetical protein Sradi_5703400 [Sesamum radiatum]|uniref:Uncharacterized protein n=1 Tax=Sesamum radiatum TaxID=300843 RepID=A0AAW2L472_SESRA
MKELPTHFRAPSDLPACDGTTDLAEHIYKFENAALLHRYTSGIKCCVFLTTLTNFDWFDQLSVGSIRSFVEFSSLFRHQFASSKKYINQRYLFWDQVVGEGNLKGLCPNFNTAILEVPIPYQEVLVSALTQGLCGGPLFEYLAKKPAIDFLDVLARAEKYMNLEDAWLVEQNDCDKRKENELPSTRRTRGEPQGHFNPMDPKNEHYTPLITSPARMLMETYQLLALQWAKGSEEGS